MRKIIVVVLLCLVNTLAQAECVILLHGLARSEKSMQRLAEHLREQDYQVINEGYPSRKHTVEVLTELAVASAVQQCGAGEKISFVTHSLGGILVRQYLSIKTLPALHRVVMLGPPNQGSEVVDKLADVPGFYFINGDAGMQLGTGADSLPNRLGAAEFDVGIIAGNRSINLLLSYLIPGSDDGKVSVARTRLSGMNEHIVMPVTHTFMMRNKTVIKQVVHYLQQGHFAKE